VWRVVWFLAFPHVRCPADELYRKGGVGWLPVPRSGHEEEGFNANTRK
jgi:hypothetical protein